MPHRSTGWIWAGRAIFAIITTVLVVYLIAVGLDKADKVASSVGGIAALLALAAPYLLSPVPAPLAGVPAVHATGEGAVALGRDSGGEVSTEVSEVNPSATAAPAGPGVTASGNGSVAIGGSSMAPIRTKVQGRSSDSNAP